MIDVTVVGDINVDLLTNPIINYPARDKQITTEMISLNPGGSAFNLAIACTKLGLKTKFIGKIGKDIFGDYLQKIIKETKLINRVKISKDEKTGITFGIAFKDKTRSFISYKGTNNTFSINDFKLSEIEGKVLAISGYNLLNSLRRDVPRLINYAKENGMKVGLDPNWDPNGWTQERLNDIFDIIKRLDWFLPDINEGEAIAYTKNDVLMVKKMLNLGAKCLLLKEGSKGCLLGQENYVKLIPGFTVESINTTGAGDVFFAAFIKAQLMGYSIEDSVIFANAAGALSTTKIGMNRYPTFDEVKSFAEPRMQFK